MSCQIAISFVELYIFIYRAPNVCDSFKPNKTANDYKCCFPSTIFDDINGKSNVLKVYLDDFSA